ncbi:MAG: META domain-containing protein [Planctomycetes bacterium]|nr:META domain-containing protein [Planctomycetota bacterium]
MRHRAGARFLAWLGLVSATVWAVPALAAGAAASPASLAGTQWRLVEFQSMDDRQGVTRPSEGTRYTLWLHGDGTATMQLNCNRATGSWSASPGADGTSGRFEFGPLAATTAVCPPPSMDETIVSQSRYVRGYLLKDGRLHLSLMADAGIYVWARDSGAASAAAVPAAPEHGGPRNWEVTREVTGALNMRERPSTAAPVVARLRPGTILDNLGCQRAEGRAWCDVQPLGGGPRGYVAATYLRPAISPDGSAAMGPDDSALRAGQGRFDATGPLPCAFADGQPMGQCEFGVARAGGGYATVVVKRPDGRTRAIFFRLGRPIGADVAESEGRRDFSATKDGDLHRIRIGPERYEIPDAVVLGG